MSGQSSKIENSVKDHLGWDSFLKLCSAAPNQDTLNALFEFLFTAEERKDLAKRVLIIQALLKENKTQREMSKQLNVSITKITRGSNALKMIDQRLKKLLKK